jgi:hypothetical protein
MRDAVAEIEGQDNTANPPRTDSLKLQAVNSGLRDEEVTFSTDFPIF